MKTFHACSFVSQIVPRLLLLLIFTAGTAFAADKFTFSESLRDKLACEGHGEDRSCDVGQVGHASITLKFAWTDPNSVSNIDEVTAFNLVLGELTLSFSPADDPKWVPGRRSASLVFAHADDSDRTVRDGKVVLRWNARGISLTLSSRTGFDLEPVLAANYIGNDPGPILDMADFEVSFGDFMAEGSLVLTGQVKERTVGSADDPTTLKAVTLHGKVATPPPAG